MGWKLRDLLRIRLYPTQLHEAKERRLNYAMAYALATWFTFGYMVYCMANKALPEKRDSVIYAKILGVTDQVKIWKFEGFKLKKIDEVEVQFDEKELDEYRKEEIFKTNETKEE